MPNEKFGCFSQVWNAGAKALVASNPGSDEGNLLYSMQFRMPDCR